MTQTGSGGDDDEADRTTLAQVDMDARAGWTLVLTASCSRPISLPPLSDLHILGVTKVPRITGIDALTTYLSAESPREPRLLFQSANVYDAGLDGSTLHEHAGLTSCMIPLSATLDGRWGMCRSLDGILVFSLSGQQQPSEVHEILHNTPNAKAQEITHDANGQEITRFVSPAWAPDGQHLAVSVQATSGCVIDIYTLSPAHDSVHLTASLELPIISYPALHPCGVDDVTWSPDNSWLTFTSNDPTLPPTLWGLRLRRLLPHLLGHEAAPVSYAVADNLLVPLGVKGGNTPPSWSADAATLMFASPDLRSIVRLDVTTGTRTTVLTQHIASICAVSQVPDNRHVVFVLCRPGGGADVVRPPAQLYVYSPPT